MTGQTCVLWWAWKVFDSWDETLKGWLGHEWVIANFVCWFYALGNMVWLSGVLSVPTLHNGVMWLTCISSVENWHGYGSKVYWGKAKIELVIVGGWTCYVGLRASSFVKSNSLQGNFMSLKVTSLKMDIIPSNPLSDQVTLLVRIVEMKDQDLSVLLSSRGCS